MLSFTLAHSTTSSMMLDVFGSQSSPIGMTSAALRWYANCEFPHRPYGETRRLGLNWIRLAQAVVNIRCYLHAHSIA